MTPLHLDVVWLWEMQLETSFLPSRCPHYSIVDHKDTPHSNQTGKPVCNKWQMKDSLHRNSFRLGECCRYKEDHKSNTRQLRIRLMAGQHKTCLVLGMNQDHLLRHRKKVFLHPRGLSTDQRRSIVHPLGILGQMQKGS